jgi:hypothetical protein
MSCSNPHSRSLYRIAISSRRPAKTFTYGELGGSTVRISSFSTDRCVTYARFSVGKDLARGPQTARLVTWDRRPASRQVRLGGPELGVGGRQKW